MEIRKIEELRKRFVEELTPKGLTVSLIEIIKRKSSQIYIFEVRTKNQKNIFRILFYEEAIFVHYSMMAVYEGVECFRSAPLWSSGVHHILPSMPGFSKEEKQYVSISLEQMDDVIECITRFQELFSRN